MADKPKRVITADQQEKMRIGRQKAYEERKLKKEAQTKEKRDTKEKQKAIQQQALQQQKDRRSNLKSAIEKRQEQKAKLATLKPQKKVVIDEEAEFFEPDIILSPVEEEEDREPTDQEYKEKFAEEAENLIKTLPHGSKQLFRKATRKFDYNLSVEDNIKGMIDYVKMVVQHNITTAQQVKAAIETKALKENEAVQEIPEVVEAEQIIESKMNYLMNKYK
tara:strand:+ start:2411 stop:3070 length:660 start_codon:yes stop_codon:yes gene_type:complete